MGISISDVDFVTALCSQVVYEGLVDDTFRIKCGKWHLGETEVCSTPRASPRPRLKSEMLASKWFVVALLQSPTPL